jgi:plasmid stability protein
MVRVYFDCSVVCKAECGAVLHTLELKYACSAIIASMATLTIRQLDDTVKAKLRVRAAEHGKSMEEEAREILRQALAPAPAAGETGADLIVSIRKRLEPYGGVDLELPPRMMPRKPPTFR